ncbi:MAG: hypothetical protein O9345_20690 [Burkholderiaceae bacterium]|jgi:Na+/proline symporter|nr:hypothetical protein [Burkholderiales bacterium]MCZ8099283.1 hypothetical protein [Burkholderiales bacterium]MCZ8340543.1 hypothetical protein [Burkholderiaceae bacterium]
MLLVPVFACLLVTIAIGLSAAKRVKNTADFAIAGRHLPMVMIVTTTFATWFGSETVLGIPAKFVQGGLGAVVEDPFGAGSCLILAGLLCLVTGALLITPEQAAALLVDDPRKVLPTLVLEPMPFVMQVIFFGALRDMRIAVPVFSACVCAYAIAMQGTPIYELVPAAYPVTLVGAFVPLLAGPYRPRGAMRGAIFSIVLGLLTWGSFLETSAGEAFPARLAGVLASAVGMLIGSVRPQALRNHHDRRVPAH